MIPLDPQAAFVQRLQATWLEANNLTLDVLRLDKVHPIVSGNKWFKLKYHLQEVQLQQCNTIATFGGAWSNHIAATAYTCKLAGLRSIGIIRGEKPQNLSLTLQQAEENGMELLFVSRDEYRDKKDIQQRFGNTTWYWIDEGGFGKTGEKGAREILDLASHKNSYTTIVAAVGTGTMLAGLINAAGSNQQVLGISSMKGNSDLQENVSQLTQQATATWSIHHEYHFGGYAKHPATLLQFMNEVYLEHQLPLDIIYTAKTLYAIKDLVISSAFLTGSKLLMIHSGGLQGNASLPPQLLAF